MDDKQMFSKSGCLLSFTGKHEWCKAALCVSLLRVCSAFHVSSVPRVVHLSCASRVFLHAQSEVKQGKAWQRKAKKMLVYVTILHTRTQTSVAKQTRTALN